MESGQSYSVIKNSEGKKKATDQQFSTEEVMDYFTRMVVDSTKDMSSEEAQHQQDSRNMLTITDAFGFIEKTLNYEDKKEILEPSDDVSQDRLSQQALKVMKQENARVFKWKEMLHAYPEKKDPKLKTRTRKGIPEAIRGYAWRILIQGTYSLDKGGSIGGRDKATMFKDLMEEEAEQKLIISIFKDVSRTMPNHCYFKDKFGVGQKSLFCVLKAVSLLEKESGYVQGMNYIAGILLTYMDMEDAFGCMIGILRGFNMRDMFLPGMPGLAKAFYIHLSLMKKYLPKL